MKNKILYITIFVFCMLSFNVTCAANSEKSITLSDLANEDGELEYKAIPFDCSERFQHFYCCGLDDYGIIFFNNNDMSTLYEAKEEYIVLSYDGKTEIFDHLINFSKFTALNSVNNFDDTTKKFHEKYGVINKEYKWVLPPIYDIVTHFNEFLITIKKGGGMYIFDSLGEIRAVFNDFNKFWYSDEYFNIICEDNTCKCFDKNFNMIKSYDLNSFERNDISKDSIDGRICNETYYRGSYLNGATIITGYSVNDGELSSLNLNKKFGENYLIDSSRVLSSGELLMRLWVGKTGKISNPILLLYSAESGEIKMTERYADELSVQSTYDIGNYIIFEDGTVFDKNLDYAGSLYKDKYIHIFGCNDKLMCLTFDCDYDSENRNKSVNNEVYLLYKSNSILNGSNTHLAKSEVDKLIKQNIEIDNITVYLNNKQVSFDTAPITENDRTLVPMRAIFEALGADVNWNDDTNTATATKDGVTVSAAIDSDIMLKNNEQVKLDAPARLIDDSRTLVPLRAVSEAFGCIVEWTDELQRVDILTVK